MSPRYNLLQKEISNRYQRTKDMLDKVVFRSGSADRGEPSEFYERVRTEPLEEHVIRPTSNEERTRMTFSKAIAPSEEDQDQDQIQISRNVDYGILLI